MKRNRYDEVPQKCFFCLKLKEKEDILSFLGVEICSVCHNNLIDFLNKADENKLKEWIERNLDWS